MDPLERKNRSENISHTESYQKFEGPQVEAFSVLKMVDEPARSGDDDVGLFGQHERLRHHVHTTNNDCGFHSD